MGMSQEFFDPELFADFIAEAKEHLETIEPRLSIIWRRASVEARITSMISEVTTMLPLRSSSKIFSDL